MSANVLINDVLQIPIGIKDFPQVTISWVQDTEISKARVIRTATYCVCYGYNLHPTREGREVLVFIATELVSDAYKFLNNHLSNDSNWDPKKNTDFRTVKMTDQWQYGGISGSDRFVVYHPKTRKPYTKRFTTAVAQTPGALNSIFADTKSGVSVIGDKDTAAMTMGLMLGLSVAQTVVAKIVDVAESAWGDALQDFK